MKTTLYTYGERPDLIEQVREMIPQSWPRFMFHDAVAMQHWEEMEETFSDYQFTLSDAGGHVVAMGNCMPFAWDGTPEGLPEHGWDGVFLQCLRDRRAGRQPNTLSALQAVVAPGHQGNGLSREVLAGMRQMAQRHGLERFVAPVRPTQKCAYPLAPMERYIQWEHAGGGPFDPWLRVHWRMGARVIGIAADSMTITGTVADWQEWTRMPFPDSGLYVVPGALSAVRIDREQDEGRYVEPNVWMQHERITT